MTTEDPSVLYAEQLEPEESPFDERPSMSRTPTPTSVNRTSEASPHHSLALEPPTTEEINGHGERGNEKAITEETRDSALPRHSRASPSMTSVSNESQQRAEPEDSESALGEVEVESEKNLEEKVEANTIMEGDQTHDTIKVEGNGDVSYDGRVGDDVDRESLPSHQRDSSGINFKRASPQPWDLVDPPPDSPGPTGNGAEFFSSGGRKYRNQNSRPPIPHSSYYFGPPPEDSAYGTQPTGQIGIHHPREILRVERDYTGGELIQFAPVYLLELEGRITPTQFLESINAINELLISAHSLRHSFIDNVLAVVTLQISRLVLSSHYAKEMQRLERLIGDLNAELYNPVGLNILWPRDVAFLFLEIEYYVCPDFSCLIHPPTICDSELVDQSSRCDIKDRVVDGVLMFAETEEISVGGERRWEGAFNII